MILHKMEVWRFASSKERLFAIDKDFRFPLLRVLISLCNLQSVQFVWKIRTCFGSHLSCHHAWNLSFLVGLQACVYPSKILLQNVFFIKVQNLFNETKISSLLVLECRQKLFEDKSFCLLILPLLIPFKFAQETFFWLKDT